MVEEAKIKKMAALLELLPLTSKFQQQQLYLQQQQRQQIW